MNRWVLLILVGLMWAGCQVPEARKPVQRSSGSFIKQSAERNKTRYDKEIADLQALIEQDSFHTYYPTEQGFWYYYERQDTTDLPRPSTGDLVEFTYAVSSIAGEVLISRDETGIQQYKVDQSNQDLISGIRQGLKFMKPGEQVTFLGGGSVILRKKDGSRVSVNFELGVHSYSTSDSEVIERLREKGYKEK